jgi:hypothetical protein
MALATPGQGKSRGQPLERALTPAEAEVIDRQAAERRAKVRPKMKIDFRDEMSADGRQSTRTISIDMERKDKSVAWRLLEASLGTSDHDFAALMMAGLSGISTRGKNADADTRALNGYLGIVQNIGPRDAVETMLAVQMAAIHGATMQRAAELANATNAQMVETLERELNRCARTFAAQIEALKRHRSKGDQRVVVEHVHVHAGGQAVVGNFNQGNRSSGDDSSGDGVRLPESTAVLGALETNQVPLQGAGDDGLERVPVSRGEGRAAIRAVK